MKVKNWSKLQHFKDRTPPWIKLYKNILDQRDINLISDCSFRVLIGLWLLASEDSEMEGNLPSIEDIAFRLRIEKVKLNKSLTELAPFLIQNDITVISEVYQLDSLETETETETETDRPALKPRFNDFWQTYPAKVGKKKCEEIWKRRKLDTLADLIIADVTRRRIDDNKWSEGYIPNPQTYLNGDRWEDEIQTRAKNNNQPAPLKKANIHDFL